MTSSFRISRPYKTPSGLAINGHNHTDKCLSEKLVPYTWNIPEITRYIFWKYLAEAHYSKKAVRLLNEQNFNFVPKSENPQNAPELHGYWRYLEFNQRRSLIRWIGSRKFGSTKNKNTFKKADQECVQKLTEGTQRRIDRIRRHGPVDMW